MKKALLILADGTQFIGTSIGAEGSSIGEVVFNTAMTGYQEIITDPSYAQQIVTLTYPHIGNVGCNLDDQESTKAWAAGLVIRDSSLVASNWRSEESLSEFLKRQSVVAIADIDTRHLTQHLRDHGAQNACITTDVDDIDAALKKAKDFPGLQGMDLAKLVSTKKNYPWQASTVNLDPSQTQDKMAEQFHVVAYDFGVKHNILRLLKDRGCKITVVPAQTPAADVIAMKPQGVFLSNGPGDPAACDYAVAAIKELLNENIPLFGICLGFQLLGLACGAKSTKMKFGHHGANHPVMDLFAEANAPVLITSQNHGFAIDETTLPDTLEVTHRSLFDNTLQGIRHKHKPAFGFQGHPEASPGPHDVQPLFDEFMALMQ